MVGLSSHAVTTCSQLSMGLTCGRGSIWEEFDVFLLVFGLPLADDFGLDGCDVLVGLSLDFRAYLPCGMPTHEGEQDQNHASFYYGPPLLRACCLRGR